MIKEEKKTMTVKEFSKEYGIGMNKAYQMIKRDDFPRFNLGRKTLILVSKIDAWFERNSGMIF